MYGGIFHQYVIPQQLLHHSACVCCVTNTDYRHVVMCKNGDAASVSTCISYDPSSNSVYGGRTHCTLYICTCCMWWWAGGADDGNGGRHWTLMKSPCTNGRVYIHFGRQMRFCTFRLHIVGGDLSLSCTLYIFKGGWYASP